MANEYRRHIARHVIVQLERYAIDGTLARAADALTVTDAALVNEDGRVIGDLEGEVLVPVHRVLWVQVV